MPITDLLERNHKLYGDEVALVELNPTIKDARRKTWKEYDLVQQTSATPYRREITWSVFDEKANRVANMLLSQADELDVVIREHSCNSEITPIE